MSSKEALNELKIRKLQKNLPLLRKIAGWSMADLGERTGVTKQTISNWENNLDKHKMTPIQYEGIMRIFEKEVEKRKKESNDKDIDLLEQIFEIIFEENLTDEQEKKFRDAFSTITIPDANKTASGMSHVLKATIGAAVGASVLGVKGAVTGALIANESGKWLKKIKEKKEEHKKSQFVEENIQ